MPDEPQPDAPTPLPVDPSSISLSSGEYGYKIDRTILSEWTPLLFTSLVKNSLGNKYYVDNSFSNYVPDGFYQVSTELTNTYVYYNIINGQITDSILIAINMPTS
jgi:hypothetical protein